MPPGAELGTVLAVSVTYTAGTEQHILDLTENIIGIPRYSAVDMPLLFRHL
jgi:hypothetical protein